MSQITNQLNIHPLVGHWLANNTYDGKPSRYLLTATDFCRSVQEVVLSRKLAAGDIKLLGAPVPVPAADIATMIRSSLGTALHDSLERFWTDEGDKAEAARNASAMKLSERPLNTRQLKAEIRTNKQLVVDGLEYTISGKFDKLYEGRLYDYKMTSTYAYNDEGRHESYKIQSSIYRWLNPDIVKDSKASFLEIFSDWNASKAAAAEEGKYPHSPVVEVVVETMSLEETEAFIDNFILQYEAGMQGGELPPCSPTQLWMGESRYGYYKSLDQKRASKNFDSDKAAAYLYRDQQGVGHVVEIPGKANKCNFCPAFTVCDQRKALQESGALKE